MKKKITFEAFLSSVSEENQAFVSKSHQTLMDHGCTIEIKEAKSGYMVAYLYQNQTLANYVFRKKGMLIRIYGTHVKEYETILDEFPLEMKTAIRNAQDCKRMLDHDACNPKCSMGYAFRMDQVPYQKCKNSAFLFLVSPQYHPYIQSLLLQEVMARKH